LKKPSERDREKDGTTIRKTWGVTKSHRLKPKLREKKRGAQRGLKKKNWPCRQRQKYEKINLYYVRSQILKGGRYY